MNCQQFEKILVDAIHSQPQSARQLALAYNHSAQCTSCALRYAQEIKLSVYLRQLASSTAKQCAPPTLKARLLTEFR